MTKVLKKKWFELIAPKIFNEQSVGETLGYEPQDIIGRVIKANLGVLTNDMKKQNTDILLCVDKAEGDKGFTNIIGLEMVPTFVRRLARKGKSRMDIVIRAITSDEKVVTVKLILVARSLIKGSVSRSIHHEIKRLLIREITKMSYNVLAEEIVMGNLQRDIKKKLDKIYPLKAMDIRYFKLERYIKAVDLRKVKENLAREKKKPEIIKEVPEAEIAEKTTEEPSPEIPQESVAQDQQN